MPTQQTLLTTFFKPRPAPSNNQHDNNISTNTNNSQLPRNFPNNLPSKMIDYKKDNHLKQVRSFLKDHSLKKNADRWQHWNGYLFLASNDFKYYSVTTLLPSSNLHKKIHYPAGFEVAHGTIDEDSALTHIEVHSDFQRQKIGSELIRFMSKACKQFTIFSGTENNSRYRLTEEGAALITYCQLQKILKAEQVIVATVPPSPYQTPTR